MVTSTGTTAMPGTRGVSAGLFFGGEPDERPRVAPRVVAPRVVAPSVVADSDEDGVPDHEDDCPNSPPGAVVDTRGCEIPDEIQLQGVQFETNSDRLHPNAALIIEDAARTLDKNRTLVVEVAGFTDDPGDAAYNRGLSERRAKTVRDYLIDMGIAEDRLTWRGYGEEQPIADNSTAEGREKNRRVVLRILER